VEIAVERLAAGVSRVGGRVAARDNHRYETEGDAETDDRNFRGQRLFRNIQRETLDINPWDGLGYQLTAPSKMSWRLEVPHGVPELSGLGNIVAFKGPSWNAEGRYTSFRQVCDKRRKL
jgi:hypothetical protein